MTLFGFFVVLGAVSVSAAAYLFLRFVRPGRVSRTALQLLLACFISGQAAVGTVVLALTWSRNDPLIDDLAIVLFVCGFSWCALESWRRAQFHYYFAETFRERDVLVRQTVQQVVETVWRYAKLYRQVTVAKTSLAGEVYLQTGEVIVANISLDDGRALDLFRELSIRFLGRYNWPLRDIGVVRATVAYRGNNTWSLDDGSGPEELTFADPPPGA